MNRLILLAGLPRSGKTTWATQNTTAPIVNPDSIRLALHGQRFAPSAEPFVWAIAKTMVRALFLAGHRTVVLDACNTTAKRRLEWESDDWRTDLHVIETSAVECIRRAVLTGDHDIIPVIKRMAAQCDLSQIASESSSAKDPVVSPEGLSE